MSVNTSLTTVNEPVMTKAKVATWFYTLKCLRELRDVDVTSNSICEFSIVHFLYRRKTMMSTGTIIYETQEEPLKSIQK